jgi:hypothetical protein
MGLLDSLFQSSTGQGGLLDFLRQNSAAAIANNPGALSSDTAQYGQPSQLAQPQQSITNSTAPIPSPLDGAQWPQGPVGSPYQANAQASLPSQPPQQAQPMAPQTGGLGAALSGFIGNLHTGPIGALAGGLASGLGLQDPATAQKLKTQNLTFQALVNKGVDPTTAQAAIGNPDMLKTLITQAYGPQTVTPLGNGYVADKQGNIKRAYEPEDKIPQGFTKDDNGNMHFVPGGPADPAYQRLVAAKAADPNAVFVLGKGGELYKKDEKGNVTIVHKNEADQAEATLDEGTTKAMASQYLAGDKSVMQNLGRGAQGAANIVKLRTEIYNQANDQGLNGKDIVNNFNEQAGNLAGQRSIGTRAANISLAANEANNMIPIALEASAKVPRGEWMPWNKMVQAYQTGTSSPELARFVAATNSLVNSYVRAVSPSGVPTDSMREHAYSMLNSAQSPKAYEAVTSIMQDEMKAAMAAPAQVRKELRHEEAPPETPKGAPKAGNYIWMPGKGLVPKE